MCAQVHFIWPNGRGALLAGVERARPSYERLLALLRSVPGSKASQSWVDRVNPFTRVRPPSLPVPSLPRRRQLLGCILHWLLS
jgi:hypothetical protein